MTIIRAFLLFPLHCRVYSDYRYDNYLKLSNPYSDSCYSSQLLFAAFCKYGGHFCCNCVWFMLMEHRIIELSHFSYSFITAVCFRLNGVCLYWKL